MKYLYHVETIDPYCPTIDHSIKFENPEDAFTECERLEGLIHENSDEECIVVVTKDQ